jgi:ribosome-associated protein
MSDSEDQRSTGPDAGRSTGAASRLGGVRIAPGVVVAEKAIDLSYSSSSGPGGQNVNKRATKCTLRLHLDAIPLRATQRARLEAKASAWLTTSGELIIQADENRSQERNRDACFDRLRELLVACLKEPKIRRKTRPSKGSKERRLTEKKNRGEIKRSRRDEE